MRFIYLAVIIILISITACAPAVQPSAPVPTQSSGAEPTGIPATPTDQAPYPAATETSAAPVPHEVTAVPTEITPEPTSFELAYVGTDGNIWSRQFPGGSSSQLITKDALPFKSGVPEPDRAVVYQSPSWSSDGSLLAFIRESSVKVSSGRNYSWDLVVYDRSTGLMKNVIENQQVTGFAWKPGSRLISYGVPVAFEFFTSNDVTNVRGLMQVDVESGTISNLVLPERSLPLAHPVWSHAGNIVAFEEISQMEGRGTFAYYDFTAAKYTSWEEAIGNYSFSPDDSQIAYDNLLYTPTGSEQISIKPLAGGNALQVSNAVSPDYAYWPVFSPDGKWIAYYASQGGMDTQEYVLSIVPAGGGEPQTFVTVFNPLNLAWSPDGSKVILARGPYDNPELVQVDILTGEVIVIGSGNQPAVAPQ